MRIRVISPRVGGCWSSAGTILVLYILLVIILRAPFW
ncbi:sporulation protein YjcZ [Paenibacillus lutimineralis]|uniref:Sporulation protein YjcZ n=1 Tax=Paenibacillus lutimineralis TaxID=2707005 RepID=A0A3Q9IDG2_9BACL|nr:sporulation protein YjcZ [Paenibacillus lutimineralis]AZS18452.1 sporulation protein YjcZ [Paenibacillus lutimineralis]